MENISDDKADITKGNEQPCSSTQADAKLKQVAVRKLTLPSTEGKSEKTLKFDSKVFVPSAASFGVGKQADPQQLFVPKVQLSSTRAVLRSLSVPMKLPEMVVDKVSDNPLKLAFAFSIEDIQV